MSPPDEALISRRRLLRATAGLTAAGVRAPAVAAVAGPADAPELSVLTRNLYVGVDLSRLFDVADLAALREVAGDLLAEIREHPYDARTAAVAAEIEAAAPDVVCVQEAALIRTRSPSRFDGDHDPGADTVEVDLLASLTAHLEPLGSAFDVAASVVTNDVEVPAETPEGPVDLRLTNRVAVLVRGDATTEGRRSARFDAGVPVPLEGVDITVRRGYAAVDLAVDGRPVTVVSTHLESFATGIRDVQARELEEALPRTRPVVVAGDLNTGPETSPETYERLTASFADAHAALRPAEAGHTCCHADDLRNETPSLTRRVDAVLYRGGGRATAVGRVGAAPGDRVRAEVAGEPVRVWPSDHAGVVATVTVPASPTPTPTGSPPPTPSATPAAGTPEEQRGDGVEPQPGFGLGATVVAGAGALVAALRRRASGGDG